MVGQQVKRAVRPLPYLPDSVAEPDEQSLFAGNAITDRHET